MSERFPDWGVSRSAGWPPGQSARVDLGTFRAPPVIQNQSVGAYLSARGSALRRLGRRPVCFRRRALSREQTDR